MPMNIPNCECESENKMFTLSYELLSKAISLGVEQGLQSLLSISNNDEQINRSDDNMASKQQFKVKLPTGKTVFITGDTVDAAFTNFAQKYGQMYQNLDAEMFQKQVPTLKHFIKNTYEPAFMTNLKETTRSNYQQYLRAYILPLLGDMKMNDISVSVIQDFYNKMANGKAYGYQKNINAKTIERVRGLLSRIFSVAVEMKIVEDTPFKNHLLRINAENAGHHKALPDKEIDRVKKEIPAIEDAEIRLYFGVLAYTGMRREEILGLRWENINLEKGIAYVRMTVTYPKCNKPVVENSAKSDYSIRPVLLPQPLIQILKPFQKETGFLFGGDEPWCYSHFVRRYRAGKKLLKIEDYNNHDFRTTYGTQLKESGMTSAQVADLMGHADTRMVETVYARAREEGILKQQEHLNGMNSKYAKKDR